MTKIKVIVNGKEVPAPGPASFETLQAVAIGALQQVSKAVLSMAAEASAAVAGFVTMPEDSKE